MAGSSSARQMWTTTDRKRVFLVPRDHALPEGVDEIRRPFSRDIVRTDLTRLTAFEVDGRARWAAISGEKGVTPNNAAAEALRAMAATLQTELAKPETKAAIESVAKALDEAVKRLREATPAEPPPEPKDAAVRNDSIVPEGSGAEVTSADVDVTERRGALS